MLKQYEIYLYIHLYLEKMVTFVFMLELTRHKKNKSKQNCFKETKQFCLLF